MPLTVLKLLSLCLLLAGGGIAVVAQFVIAAGHDARRAGLGQ
jgi:hypothetical protein